MIYSRFLKYDFELYSDNLTWKLSKIIFFTLAELHVADELNMYH